MVDRKTDAALVEAAVAGQREAFADLVIRYQDYAYGVAVGMLSDFELARDVVQETFLCAYRDLRKLRDPARFGGWLRGIVRHTAHRALREIGHVRSLAEELGRTTEPFAQTPAPDRSAEDAERREVVRRALARLNEKNREAVSLYYVDGLSYADIAGFLDVTETAVQGRLQRARVQLRKELKMVKETFREEELPEDFAAEIRRLLDEAAARVGARKRAIRRLTEIGAPAVGPLCEALEDPRLPVLRIAARALCAIGDPKALQPLLRGLCGHYAWGWKDDVFRDGRVLAIPGARDAFLKAIREGGQRTELWVAFQALSYARGDREVYACIYEAFRDEDAFASHDRQSALEALCRLSPESAVDVITEALNGSDLSLRRLASWLAVRDGFLPPIAACLNAFSEGVGWWGRVCAANLVLEHGEEGRQTLERVMRTGAPVERATAAMGLARTGHEEAFEVLREELLGAQPDRKWTKAVSRTMASRYGRKFAAWIDAGGRSLVDHIPGIMWTLARSRSAQAGPMVEVLFREGTRSVRAAALRVLARQRGADFLPELRRCLSEGRPRKVAQEAFRQLFRLKDAAMPMVQEMLGSEMWTERKAAVCLLRRWGRLTPEQKARAERDPHVAVRHAAVEGYIKRRRGTG